MSEIMNARETADYIGVTTETLKAWRKAGDTPPYARLRTNCIRYMKSDVDSWIKSHIKPNTKAGAL